MMESQKRGIQQVEDDQLRRWEMEWKENEGKENVLMRWCRIGTGSCVGREGVRNRDMEEEVG